MTIFQMRGVRSGYGPIDILQGLDLQVERGEIVGVFGPNGSGKSVLLKTMAGLLNARSGAIRFEDREITDLDAPARTAFGIGLLPQTDIVFPGMTVQENLQMGVFAETDRKKKRGCLEETYSRYPMLAQHRYSAANALSGGQQKTLGLARAMMLKPRLLLLDEPSIGLDPKSLAFFANELNRLNNQGVTLIMVEQNVRFALEIVKRACFLKLGVIRHEQQAASIRSPADVLLHYFNADSTGEARAI